jgi:hypothetical protein
MWVSYRCGYELVLRYMVRRSQDRLRKSLFLFGGTSGSSRRAGGVASGMTMGAFGAVAGRSGFGPGSGGTGWRLDPHLAL